MKVYLAILDAHYEGDNHLGIYASKDAALRRLALEAEKDRKNGNWHRFILSKDGEEWKGQSVTLRIEEFEVEE